MVTKLYGGCPVRPSPILPAIFDDIMSYEQQIGVLCAKFNELCEWTTEKIDGLEDNLTSMVTNQFNILAKDLRVEFNNLSNDFKNLEEEFGLLESKFDAFKQDTTDKLNETLSDFYLQINNRITTVERNMQYQYNDLRQYVDQSVDDVTDYSKSYTDAEIARLEIATNAKLTDMQKQIDRLAFSKISLFNWFRHEVTTLQVLMDDIWSYMRGCALDARETDVLPLTADVIDGLELPAYQYDTQSWRRLYFNLVFVPEIKKLIDSKTMMRDPYTGELIPNADVINKVFDSINFNGKTLPEYDSLRVTAAEFDNSDFNAFTQDTDKNWRSVSTDYKNKWIPFTKLAWENPTPEEYDYSTPIYLQVDHDKVYQSVIFECGISNQPSTFSLTIPLDKNLVTSAMYHPLTVNLTALSMVEIYVDEWRVQFIGVSYSPEKMIPRKIFVVEQNELV